MDYVNLGRAGVKVSRFCLGGGNFGGRTDEAESARIIAAALDAGVNFIDTANWYNEGRSEEIIGRAVEGVRDDLVLATKVEGPVGEGPNDRGLSRYHIIREVERSLRRLRTDRIDLYQLHRPDPAVPLDETLSALTDLVRAGKVRYIGASTFPAWRLCESLWISDVRRLERFVSEQPPYSILCRGPETELLPFCAQHGFAVLPWSPLAGGWLSGKYRLGEAVPSDSRAAAWAWEMDTPPARRRYEAVEALLPVAQSAGVPLARMALAWLSANPAVTSVLVGPRTVDQLRDCLASADVAMPDDLLRRIDGVVPPGADLMDWYLR